MDSQIKTEPRIECYGRTIFKGVPEVIWDCLVFALLRSVIGPENILRHSLNHQIQNLNQSGLGHSCFSRFRQFGCFYCKFSSALKGISFFLTDCFNYFGLVFRHYQKSLYLAGMIIPLKYHRKKSLKDIFRGQKVYNILPDQDC